MMRLKVFNLIGLIMILYLTSKAQNTHYGKIYCNLEKEPLSNVQIYDFYDGFITNSDSLGNFKINSLDGSIKLVFHKEHYNYFVKVFSDSDTSSIIYLQPLAFELNEIIVNSSKNDFNSGVLSDIVEDAIYAGKKTKKIILSNTLGSVATNNARQIYNKIAGLNIFQNDDAGLQLNIGSRGLNPNRSANFNTRQNSYDISADVLGYPESYYTPPAEALEQIQVVKGAASLQYGTQFGGLINFVFKKPNQNKKFCLVYRNTLGSNNLLTNFTSINGSVKKIGYYSFINYKKGDGFRKNSAFESINFFTHFNYSLSKKIKVSAELTFLEYLAQQAGGLTDNMFYSNPLQSNRERNWFKVKWLLYNTKIAYKINRTTKFNLNIFSLNAYRYALGFRDNRVDQLDPLMERDLIKGVFNNIGAENRILKNYKLFKKSSVLLLGAKIYKSSNTSEQGPGSSNYDANFNYYYNDIMSSYVNQSYYDYPNINYAVFWENIFYMNDLLSITPGFRYEYINTKSNGNYTFRRYNLIGATIFDTTYYENRSNQRSFILFGAGLSYKANKYMNMYSNISQNYRSVTFADMSIKSPSFVISPDLNDEDGYTFDIGLRSLNSRSIQFDINYFQLNYNNRIGFVQKIFEEMPGYFVVKTEKGNIGSAKINGIESLFDVKLKMPDYNKITINSFINFSYTKSKYLNSQINGIIGNEVEFTPKYNIKYGLNIVLNNHTFGMQYSYVSDQYTDASNADESDITGIIGKIPAYYIYDFSYKMHYRFMNLYFGINNLSNNIYFTRRATGYPGPGIIPSPPRNYYITLEFKI